MEKLQMRRILRPLILLLVVATALLAIPSSAATIFNDNFESGNLANWTSTTVETGATLEVIAGAAKNGAYGLRSASDGSNDDAHANKTVTGVAEIWTTFWFKVAGNLTTGNHEQVNTLGVSPGSTIGAMGLRTQATYTNRLHTLAAGSWVISS